MAGYKSKLGPIPKDWFENDPGMPGDVKHTISAKDLARIDKEIEARKIRVNKILGDKKKVGK